MPPPIFTAQQLIDRFKNKNLTAGEMVLLSVGRSFYSYFVDRIWNGNTPIVRPSSETLYELRGYRAETVLRSAAAGAVLARRAGQQLLQAAAARHGALLLRQPAPGRREPEHMLVNRFAGNETLWKERFAAAMVEMGRIQMQTGNCCQVRLNCKVVNPSTRRRRWSAWREEDGLVATS
ncbi:hypothetical protein VPH35_134952 [Triticum aestivum]|uniref:Peroxidase 1 n=1 Tax=Aegilops tauschii TaxID=37682 RepID=M8B7V0_AEGTA